MGKNLTFADVEIRECDERSPGKKIEVVFQRGVPGSIWNDETSPTNNQFPNKNAALPYGALVSLDVSIASSLGFSMIFQASTR